jgi:hypothetical protein
MADEAKQPTRFAPVVLLGLGSATLLTVTSARAWFKMDLPQLARVGLTDDALRADMPLALALSLVVLAGWGVVLVSRRRLRRVALAIALFADLGVLACAAQAPFTLPDQIREQVLDGDHMSAFPTYAYLVAVPAAVLALAALVVGLRLAPRWPEMSSRYDAPTASAAPAATDDLSLWKALDEGHDPTAPPSA